MDVIFWAAIILGVLGVPRLVWAFIAANKRVEADLAFMRAIPADMDWPTEDIDPERVEK